MQIVVAILLVLVAIPLLLLGVPFHARVAGSVHDEDLAGAARFDWGWGLFAVTASFSRGVELRLLGLRVWRFRFARKTGEQKRKAKEAGEAKKKAKAAQKAGEPHEKQEKKGRLGAPLRHRGRIIGWAVDLLRALRPRLRARGQLGLDDPADTAVLFNALAALAALPGVELDVDADWAGDALDLEVEAELRVWLVHLVAVALLLLAKRENRLVLKELRGAA